MNILKNPTFAIVLLLIIFKVDLVLLKYQAAVVQYYYDEKAISKYSPIDLTNKNAANYIDVIRHIKNVHGSLDIVLFPEASLVAAAKDNLKTFTFVPDITENVIPCESRDNYAGYFKELSCAAKTYKTYVAVNLIEIQTQEEQCYLKETNKTDNYKLYNTNVVFDRNGKVVARYRKYNVYLEPDISTTPAPELITFSTDFNETFGIFTCFDILFDYPALGLVKKNVKHFLYPTMWYSELPFLTASQVQQMWAEANNAVFLTSNVSYKRYGMGGSGIYLGKIGSLKNFKGPLNTTQYIYEEVNLENINIKPKKIDEEMAEDMDQYIFFQEDLSDYTWYKLNTEKSADLKLRLCDNKNNGEFCCKLAVQINVNEAIQQRKGDKYVYYVVVKSGTRTFGNGVYTLGIDVCGLVACKNDSISGCGKRFNFYNDITWPVTFKKLHVTANFSAVGTKQYPNSLLADFSSISSQLTSFSSKKLNDEVVEQSFSFKSDIKQILSFAIWGRNFKLDKK